MQKAEKKANQSESSFHLHFDYLGLSESEVISNWTFFSLNG